MIHLLHFMASGQFVNFCQIHPNLPTQSNLVNLANRNALAISIMPLLVQASFVQHHTQGGVGKSDVYKLTGLLFSQEFRQDLVLWGLKLDFVDEDIGGLLGSFGIAFSSRYQKLTMGVFSRHSVLAF